MEIKKNEIIFTLKDFETMKKQAEHEKEKYYKLAHDTSTEGKKEFYLKMGYKFEERANLFNSLAEEIEDYNYYLKSIKN